MYKGWLSILLVGRLLPVRCLPTGNSSDNSQDAEEFVGYVADPNGRGTASLIISCLLTLILCVWSALHLNVPRLGTTRAQKIRTMVLWITAGIYAPEMVVFTAWRQWSSAKILSKTIAERLDVNEKERRSSRKRKHAWTLTHSFFASTGGFAVDCTDYIDDGQNTLPFLPRGTPRRLTVSARGMEFLAKCDLLPDVPREDIEDKSKADHLAKCLVLLQASWMLLQVLGRLAVHLPVTLLEVNTVAHVLCAISMYLMWWDKPLTPKEPITIDGSWTADLLAFMYLSSEVSGKVNTKHRKSQTIVKTFFATFNLYSKTPEIESICYRRRMVENNITPDNEESTLKTTVEETTEELDEIESGCLSISEHCRKLLREKSLQKEAGTAFFERRPKVRADTMKLYQGDPTLKRRRELFCKTLQDYAITTESISFDHHMGHHQCLHYHSRQLLVEYSHNWPSDELLRNVGGLVVGMVLWLANFLYGGIHAAAWNDHFPSSVEKWMWRSSASYIGFCGGLWVILNFIVSSSPKLNDFWERWMEGKKSLLYNISLGMVVFVCGFSLLCARVFIVVEAFLSIRNLPASAYQTPTWSQVFPHF